MKSLSEGTHTYEYVLDDNFFKLINDGDSDIKKGEVKVALSVKRLASTFELNFTLDGEVQVPCDRCLDYIAIPIETHNRIIVKFGREYSEESDEIVVIPEDDGEINIAWFLYEFAALSVPMKRVHPQGQCNRLMATKLNKHRAVAVDDEEETDMEGATEEPSGNTDPRWDSLKGLNIEE